VEAVRGKEAGTAVGGCERRRRWGKRAAAVFYFLREEGLRLRKRNGFRVFYL
jgi:hypothetical protein